MVEPRTGPVIHAVALGAVGGKAAGDMVRIDSCLEVGAMTSYAGSTHSDENAAGRALVAALTGRFGVSTQQRETVVMIERRPLRNR